MKKSIFILPTSKHTGLRVLASSLGLSLQQRGLKVDFFHPIYDMEMSIEQIEEYLLNDRIKDYVELVLSRFYEKCQESDFIIVSGLFRQGDNSHNLYQINSVIDYLNVEIIKALSAEVIVVSYHGNKPLDDINHEIEYAVRSLPKKINILGVIITKLNAPYNEGKIANIDLMGIPVDDQERIQKTLETISSSLDRDQIIKSITADISKQQVMSPPAFRYHLLKMARRAKKRIILPESYEPRTLQAAKNCHEQGLAECVLIGDREKINKVAELNGFSLPDEIEIVTIDTTTEERYLDVLVELRKHKGLSRSMAKDALKNPIIVATLMLYLGEVDGLVSGAEHTTADVLRPALQLIKTKPNISLVSSVFFMCMPDEVIVFGDCAVNQDPTAEQLVDIAIQSAESAKKFNIEPRVAMISYSTGNSGSGAQVEKVRAATEMLKQKAPELLVDGPLQYDAAMIESVANKKAPNSPVAGKATVLIFPDLNTGNTVYKAVQRSANILSIGPVLQGINKPVNDLSRGATVDDITYTIAITAIQSI